MAILSSCKEDRDEYIGNLEIISGLGMLVGPIAGAFAYSVFGYIGPFYVVGGIFAVMILVFLQMIKNVDLIED